MARYSVRARDHLQEGWDPKTDERVIPISPVLYQILREQWEHRRSDHWVFANKYGNQISHPLDKLKAICRRAGIAEATLHGLRHSFGSHLRMAGTSLADIVDLMGHKDLATTQIYAKVEQTHLRSIVGGYRPWFWTRWPPRVAPKAIFDGSLKDNLLLINCLVGQRIWLGDRDFYRPSPTTPMMRRSSVSSCYLATI